MSHMGCLFFATANSKFILGVKEGAFFAAAKASWTHTLSYLFSRDARNSRSVDDARGNLSAMELTLSGTPAFSRSLLYSLMNACTWDGFLSEGICWDTAIFDGCFCCNLVCQ